MSGLNRAKLNREIAEMQRRQFRERLSELRKLITVAREAKKTAIKAVQTDCAARRVALREQCQARALDARQRGSADVVGRRKALRDERAHDSEIRRATKPARARSSARERKEESDDYVRANLAPEMVPVFNAVRRHIKGGPRKTRTEAFLEWVNENPDEVWPVLQHEADRDLAKLIAEEERTQRALARAQRSRSAVPF